MAAALLDHMDASGQDGLAANDLVDWYMTSDNYSVPGSGVGKSPTGSEGGEDVDDNEVESADEN